MKCGDRAPYDEGDEHLHKTYADDAESCCKPPALGEVVLGLYPIVTLEKQLPNMMGNLV